MEKEASRGSMLFTTNQSLRDCVIRSLGTRERMEAVELHKLIRSYGLNYSIQALYKELRILLKEGVVAKSGKSYSLHIRWLLEMRGFISDAFENLTGDGCPREQLPGPGEYRKYSFRELNKLNTFWTQLLLTLQEQSKACRILEWVPHPWFHLGQYAVERRFVKALKLSGGKIKMILGGETQLDQIFRESRDPEVYTTYFREKDEVLDYAVYYSVLDDYLLTVQFTEAFQLKVHALYEAHEESEKLDLERILSFFSAKGSFTLRVDYNTRRSRQIKKHLKAVVSSLEAALA